MPKYESLIAFYEGDNIISWDLKTPAQYFFKVHTKLSSSIDRNMKEKLLNHGLYA